MSNQLVAKDIFGRNHFKSYSEFYLALAMSSVLKDRGYVLNMDGMMVDADTIPDDMIKYYKKLLFEGAISLSMYVKPENFNEVVGTDIDTTYFSKIQLYEVSKNSLDWSISYATENYGDYRRKFLELLSLGNTLIHLIAYHLVNHILDGEERKLSIHLDSQKAKSTFIYVNIYSCLQTMPWIREYIHLDVDLSDYDVDLDYSIHCNNGKVAGRYRLWTINEKLELLKKYGMVEGSILVLWERDGMCENNIYGKITGAKLFRLDEIGDNFLGVTIISVNKTKEEVRQDYNDIDESVRYLFVDMLGKKPHLSSVELDITGFGVDNYFFDEDRYITLLDEGEEVYKLVTIDGQLVNQKMSGVDAIYWLLCQYEVEFDKELFKTMYFNGKEPMWDMYN